VNRLLDADLDEREDGGGDREISLGVGTILGIFFALALLCAGFFGFGYTLGRKSAQNSQNAAAPSSAAPESPSGPAKPDAGSLIGQPVRPAANPAPLPAERQPAAPPRNVVAPADATIAGDRAGGDRPAPASQQPGSQLPPPAISPTGTFMVQIAAVSSQDIADIELTALKKYGYDVVVRHEPQDQLLHIQIGPFATRKDAEAMRQNVLAHGFNAIVK